MQIHYFQNADYQVIWQAMRAFTDTRISSTSDELWIVEHQPVYTLGQNGRREHVLHAVDISIINTDRGGQVTYHGPGQLVIYTLLDLHRMQLGIRALVSLLENSMIALLADFGIKALARADAPGVYVNAAKIGAVGLRIRRGCAYHGLALNVDMDLTPFQGINPCGYANMAVTQLSDWGIEIKPFDLAPQLVAKIEGLLNVI